MMTKMLDQTIKDIIPMITDELSIPKCFSILSLMASSAKYVTITSFGRLLISFGRKSSGQIIPEKKIESTFNLRKSSKSYQIDK